jgi:AraC family transcriptional regulator, regulatory protein of adaptative response / DNA-3-methyladenine glycosylase II
MSVSVWRRAGRAGHDRGVTTFNGVVTTGIYCLPGCNGRPLAHNVRVFPLAASAEAAGFRACLRCRPYRMQPSASGMGPELVCQAVRLVIDGAMDHGTEHDLGARLGISGRQLRRLFDRHLGVTPDQLARSARVHFARRLLDDTDLPVTELAFAAGFGSVRQFNRSCLEVFRAAPGDLRARRRVSDRLRADGGLALRAPFQPPLDWDAMLGHLRACAIPGVEHVSADSYRRTVVIDGDPGVLELSPGGPEHLVFRAHLPHWAGLIHVVRRARRIASLDADIEAANRDLGTDPLVGGLVAARPGMRLPGAWDPFEAGIGVIVTGQASPSGTTATMGRLVERHGGYVPGLRALGLTHVFPSPAGLAAADLSGLGLGASRISAIRGLARAVTDGAVDLDRVDRLETLIASLTAIRGLSTAAAHCLATRLGHPDAFPAASPALLRAMAQATGRAMTAQEAQEIAGRWRPWRAHAAMHLGHQAGPGDDSSDPLPAALRCAGHRLARLT